MGLFLTQTSCRLRRRAGERGGGGGGGGGEAEAGDAEGGRGGGGEEDAARAEAPVRDAPRRRLKGTRTAGHCRTGRAMLSSPP